MSEKTEYAKSLGYRENLPVIVFDGFVVSHGNAEWLIFCERLRMQA